MSNKNFFVDLYGNPLPDSVSIDPLTAKPVLYINDAAGKFSTFSLSGNVATDAIWQAPGDLVVGTGVGQAAILPIGSALQVLQVNAGATGFQYATLSGGGNALTSNPLSQFAATTSAQLAGVISDETGTGSLVFGTSPTLTTPNLGTPSAVTLTNGTGLPVATGISGLGTGVATFLATPSSANLAAAVTGETGTGALVFANSPTFTTPNLGTPSAITLTNATGLSLTTGVTGLLPVANGGTGTATPGLVAGTNVTITGTWPNQTINSTASGTGNVSNSGTPTSGQVAVWTNATTVQGVTATGTGSPVLATSPTVTTPTLSGIVTTDGANVTTAAAMGALAIDVTKGLNTKTIAVDSTFTFSGTPATANTWFSVHVINSDTNPHTLTFPSAFSMVTQAARTTCPIPASGQLWMMFRYDGSTYHVYGDGQFLNNTTATTNPSTSNDVTQGYGPGSFWFNTSANTMYWCESNGSGAAVWNSPDANKAAKSQTLTFTKSFFVPSPVDGKVAAWLDEEGITITKMSAITDSGTTTLTASIAGTNVTGTAVSASSTYSSQTYSAGNVSAGSGAKIAVTASSSASPVNLEITVVYTRAITLA